MKKLFKKIYSIIPFKKQFFRALKKVWKPSEKIYRHLHFKGTIDVPVTKSESFKIVHYGFILENDIFWDGLYGGWEKISLELWTKLCRNSKVVMDIGANTGVYSLLVRR